MMLTILAYPRPNRYAALIILSPDLGYGPMDMNPKAFDGCTLSFDARAPANVEPKDAHKVSINNGIIFSSKVAMGNAQCTSAYQTAIPVPSSAASLAWGLDTLIALLVFLCVKSSL